MAFDWDKHPEVGSFNWDSHPTVDVPVPYSKSGSALMGALNQFNVAPAVGAAAEHPISATEDALNPLLRLIGSTEFSKENVAPYEQARQGFNTQMERAKSDNPWSYTAGNVALGLALTPFIPGAAAAKGALGGAALGAKLGAASGVGNALSSGKGLPGIATEGVLSSAIGGITGGVAGKLLGSLTPESLDQTAAEQGLKAVGTNKSDIKRIINAPGSADIAQDVINNAGSILVKPTQWLDGKSIVQAGSGKEDILNNLEAAKKAAGQYIGGVAKEADETGFRSVNTDNALQFIDKQMKKYLSPKSTAEEPLPFNLDNEAYNILNKAKQDVLDLGGTGGNLKFEDANKILQFIDRHAYNIDGTIKNPDLNQLRGVFNTDIEKGLSEVANKSGNPDIYSKFIDAKNLYHTGSILTKAAQGNMAAGITNKELSLTDFLAGGFGHAMAGNPGTAVAAGANKVARSYGAGALAQGARGAANFERNVSTKLSNMAPDSMKNMATKFSSSENPALQTLGRIFNQASDKDQVGRNAVIFSLMQNPTYRDLLNSVSE